jgi:tetratricopeptide (TPR) repeat protein
LFLEHLHPTAEGQFLMSEAFFDGMLEKGLLKKEWLAKELLPNTYYRQNWPVTALDNALTKIRIIGLKDHWPFVPEHQTTNSATRYNPKSRSEELAKNIFLDKVSYKRAQNDLAGRFINEQEFALATNAYQALTKAQPFDIGNINQAATNLIAARQFQAAVPFLRQSLKLEDSFYANKWLGQTLIFTNKVEEGIPYLEKAKQINGTDTQVLSNLARTYFSIGNKEMAILNLEELKAIDSNHPYVLSLKSEP